MLVTSHCIYFITASLAVFGLLTKMQILNQYFQEVQVKLLHLLNHPIAWIS